MIASKTWREISGMTLVYFIILAAMLIPAVSVWPDLYADFQRGSAMAKAFGSIGEFAKRITSALQSRDEDIAYLSYMALQMYFKGTNVAGIAAAVLLGTGLFARERESMTLEFLLSRPISRAAVLWAKVWPCLLAVTVPIFLANWLAIPMSNQIGFGLPFRAVTLCSVHAAAFTACFLLLTVLASVLCRVQTHCAFAVGGLVIVELAMYFVPVMRLSSVFRLSDFDWYGPIMAGNHGLRQMFDPFSHPGFTTWLLIAAVLLYLAALHALRRLEL
jgi:ABC-type transport system involved in multi-copper enzyme maturation permease subunit